MALKMVKIAEEATIDADVEDVRHAEEKPPLIPDGEYEVAFVAAGKPYWIFHQERVMLWFQIIDPGEHNGKRTALIGSPHLAAERTKVVVPQFKICTYMCGGARLLAKPHRSD